MGGRISAERLRQLVSYDKDTGVFRLLVDRAKYKRGHVLGCIHHSGYRHIELDGRKYIASNLAWLYVTGKWPDVIDHKNRCRADDRWANLRLATNGLNRANSIPTSNTGTKGVWKRKRYATGRDRFVAQITVNRKVIHLGHFDTLAEASAAYAVAAEKAFGVFARP